MTIRIAHLSDVHLAPIQGLGPRHVNIKRGLGLANWMLKRRKVHLRSAVDALVEDMRHQAIDHVIVSGDLTNLGLPGEHTAALAWLEALGPPSRVSVVPGNHDIYCRLWRDPGVLRWKAYMSSDGDAASMTASMLDFPYVRRLGRLAIVGVNSAIPTRPFYAIGEVGEIQLSELGKVLSTLNRDRLWRLVVIHHPPLPGQADARRGLVDAERLEKVLVEHGAELVLHGHNHHDMLAERTWRGGRIDVVGVASASIGRAYKDEPLGRYNIIEVDPDRREGGIRILARGLAAPGGPVVDLGMRRLSGRSEPNDHGMAGSSVPRQTLG